MNYKWRAQCRSDKVFDVVNYTLLALLAVICLYPLYYIVIVSFSRDVVGAYLLPNGFTLEGYKAVLRSRDIWTGYANTIFYTAASVVVSLTITLPCAYSLSRRDLDGRNAFMGFLTVTMFIGGGMIPTYLVYKSLGLLDRRMAIILSGACSTYNIIVARTFFRSTIPDELLEAAKIDGCGNGRFFVQIALPLSKPILAVLALWVGVGRWNSYFTEMLYLRSVEKYPLSLFLRQILWRVQAMKELLTNNREGVEITSGMLEQAKLASIMQYVVIIFASAPLLAVYPFIQKYFTKGVMIGSVKG